MEPFSVFVYVTCQYVAYYRPTMSPCAFILAAGIFGVAAAAFAAEADRISSDRPDFLTSPDVVGKGRFQIELGPFVQREDGGMTRVRTVTTPTLLRLGVTDKLELQVETEGRMRRRETDLPTQVTVYESGYADASLGIKWNSHQARAEKGTPGIGWVFQLAMPSGSREFRGQGVRPAMIGAFEWELTEDLALGANAGLTYDRSDAGRRFLFGTLGVGLSKSLRKDFLISAEIVAQQIARSKHGGTIAIFDVSAAYFLTDNVQVDALVGRGITAESPKYLFTAGISARF